MRTKLPNKCLQILENYIEIEVRNVHNIILDNLLSAVSPYLEITILQLMTQEETVVLI